MVIARDSQCGRVHWAHATQGIDVLVRDGKNFRAVSCHAQIIMNPRK